MGAAQGGSRYWLAPWISDVFQILFLLDVRLLLTGFLKQPISKVSGNCAKLEWEVGGKQLFDSFLSNLSQKKLCVCL